MGAGEFGRVGQFPYKALFNAADFLSANLLNKQEMKKSSFHSSTFDRKFNSSICMIKKQESE